MFRPNKNVQLGGGYTNVSNILNSDIFDILSPENHQIIQTVTDTPTRNENLTSAYNSTILSIGSTISSLEAEFSRQTQLSIESINNKHIAYQTYLGTLDSLEKYNTAYIYSSMLCSSYMSTLNYVSSYVSTSTAMLKKLSTYNAVQTGGARHGIIDMITILPSSSYLIAMSTMHGSSINQQISIINNVNIPRVLYALSTYYIQYVSASKAYLLADIPIKETILANKLIRSRNSTLNASIAVITARINNNYGEYQKAIGLISADNAIIKYLSTLQLDTQTYLTYNSTIVTMQKIENIYNLVMNGLPVAPELINAIPVQQGGGLYTSVYEPTYIVSTIVCDPADTVCNKKVSTLNNYMNAYFSLSTALPIYSQNYEIAHQARIDAEKNTSLRLSTILQDTFKGFDDRLAAAQRTIQDYESLLREERATLSNLYAMSTSSTISISSSLFTDDEIADLMSYGEVTQSGGSEINESPIVNIKYGLYTRSNIDEFYSTQLITYNNDQITDQNNLNILQTTYMDSIITYQDKVTSNEITVSTKENILRRIDSARVDLDANNTLLTSLVEQMSSISTAIINNSPANVVGSANVRAAINDRVELLSSFETSTIKMNQILSTYYNNEMNLYMNTLSQISSYVLNDATQQQYEMIVNPSASISSQIVLNNIGQLSTFLSTTLSYMAYINIEQEYKNLYLDAKNIYELDQGLKAKGTDPANLLTTDSFNKLKLNYDIYVSQINTLISNRKIFNAFYVSTISTMSQYLDSQTMASMYASRTYNTSTITLLPYTMRFEYISSRILLFNQGSKLPEPVIPDCPPTTFIDGTPQTTSTVPTPTTTLDTVVYGIQGKYVEITRADNNFEILQVIVIDSKGKNVAFQKPVLVSPSAINMVGRAQYITNGAYSVSSNFIPPIGINGSGTYMPSIDNNSALGTITCDPITGLMYVFNMHTQQIQRVSADLKTVTNYADCTNYPNSCISAYNGIIYAVDSLSSTFYSVNSSGVKTIIQQNVGITESTAISNVYNDTIYITTSGSINTIMSYNIANSSTPNIIASSEPSNNTIMNISIISKIVAIAIGSDGIIYVVDNGMRIISLKISINEVSVITGDNSGFTDGPHTDSMFNNITAMCIDSQNNLFVTDASNNVIRKVDTLTGYVTTYTSGSSPLPPRLIPQPDGSTLTQNALYTTGSTIPPNTIAVPANTSPSYMSYLYSICITGSNIYTTSYNPNGASSTYPYPKNATVNTWITSIPYSSYGGTSASTSYFVSTGTPAVLTIDLGTTTDITAIRYVKKNTSYSSVGLIFSILDSNRVLVGTPKQISIDLGVTLFDLRATNSLNIPIIIVPKRNGVAGILGRYVKLSSSVAYYYAISQISVITTDGTNLAIGARIFATMGGTNISSNASKLINGTYNSLPESASFVYASTSASDYIIIDLLNEYDITAVNLYYSRGSDSTIQNAATITILTADMQVSLTQATSQYHTTMLKEIIDFRSSGIGPISVKWPPFYGTAGVIARYIRIARAGQLAFSKLQVIDRTGLDVAQFLKPTVSSGGLTALNAVTNVAVPRLKAQGYLSNATFNEYFLVDLLNPCEICIINLYGCIDIDLMSGLTISLYSSDPSGPGVSPLITYNAIPGLQIQRFDTRYEPNTSNYPTTVTRNLSKYGPFGVYAQTICIYTVVSPTAIIVVDALGNSISYTIAYDPPNNGVFKTTCTLIRMYEITSILIELSTSTTEKTVQLYDCYNVVVAAVSTVPLATEVSYATTAPGLTWYVGDFRNYLNTVPNPYAPIVPWPIKRGGYRLTSSGSLSESAPYTTSGIKARYIKIIPCDPVTPLYISQILAVDEFGINRAFQKQTFTANAVTNTNIQFPANGKNAVDGIYEAQIDNTEILTLFFTKYKRKSIPSPSNLGPISYVSQSDPMGTAIPTTYAFFIDLDLDQTNIPSFINDANVVQYYMDPENGKEYSINSIIYVAADGKGAESEGVIIQLLDDELNIVGSQPITRMASVFGVDILDFRADIGMPMDSIPNRVEVRERIITPGPCGSGVLTQYVRIEQSMSIYPIQLSYVVITDTTGNDVAMFKPTYSSSNNMSSFMIVDGNNYLKDATNTFTTMPSANEYQYIEINLGKEYELINLQVGDVFGSTAGFSTLRVRLYNKDRDVIGSQTNLVPATVRAALGVTTTGSNTIANTPLDTNNFMYLSKVGVGIANNLASYKYNSGLIPASPVSSFSIVNRLPSLLAPLTGASCTPQNTGQQRYSRVNGGIPCRYVRIYNVGQYIQVSQLMVYDTTGENVAHKAAAYATSILPNNYAAYATDGKGGFFHMPRDESKCFISGNNPYDYLEIDLGRICNVIAVRYIPPTTNASRNIGVRAQLLDDSRNILDDTKVILSEKIISTQGDTVLDYRIYSPMNPPISQMISPKIYTAATLYGGDTIITGFCIRQDNFGTPPNSIDSFYYVNPYNGGVRGILSTNSNITVTPNPYYYANPATTNTNLMGLHYSSDDNAIYVADYAANKIIKLVNTFSNGKNSSTATDYITTGLINPYSLVKIGNLLYISENRLDGKIYSYDGTTLSSPIYTADNIGSITVDWSGNILACVGSAKTVVRIILGSTDRPLPLSGLPNLQYPSGIAVDVTNKVIFVSDILSSKIYAFTPSNVWIVIAGTGVSGYSGDDAGGIFASLNGPFFLQYYPARGCLYFADKNNNVIRKIDLQSCQELTVSTTTLANPQIAPTTTQPAPTGPAIGTGSGTSGTSGTSDTSDTSATTATTAIAILRTAIIRPETNDTYIQTLNTPMLSEILNDTVAIQCCFTIPPDSTGIGSYLFYYASEILYKITPLTSSYNSVSSYTYNINMTSIVAGSDAYIYMTSSSQYKIYKASLASLSTLPTTYCGSGTTGYSPDGTSALVANIIPYGITYNTKANTTYFTDCQAVCGLVRKLSSTNRLQTLVGLYSSTPINIDPTTYYTFTRDLLRPEINPLAIYLVNPTAIISDSNGYTYIADSGTNCIHRLTPWGSLQPVCGPFRTTTTPIDFLNNYAIDIPYNAYSVKINTPNSLAFDSNMNLICTSLNGCQIISISNLDALEPSVQVIYGLGVNIHNLQNYTSITVGQYAKYLNPVYPRSICYSYATNSLYYIDNNGKAICSLTLPYNSILSKTNNGSLSNGVVNILTTVTNANYMTIDMNENIYYSDIQVNQIKKYSNTGVTTTIVSGLNSLCDLSIYNDTYIYYIISFNKKIFKYNLITNTNSDFITDIDEPRYLVVHESGYIFVSYTNKIKVIYIKDQTPVFTTILNGNNYGAIGIDNLTNNLYVTSFNSTNNTNTIQKYPMTFSSNPSPSQNIAVTGLSATLNNIICDYTAGTLYISDATTVYQLVASNNYSSVVSFLQGVSNPKSMYFYSNIIYVADTGNNRICTINATSGDINSSLVIRAGPDSSFSSPSGIFVNSSYIYIADTGNNRICIQRQGNNTWIIITNAIAPLGIVVDSNNIIYYTSLNKLYSTTLSGNASSQTPTQNLLTTYTGATNLGQLSIDSNNILSTNDNAGNIIRYTTSGSLIDIVPQSNLLGFIKYNNTYYYVISSGLKSFYYKKGVNIATTPSYTWNKVITDNVRSITAYNGLIYCIISNALYKLIPNNATPQQCSSFTPNSYTPTSLILMQLNSPMSIRIARSGSIIISNSTQLMKIENKQKVDTPYKIYTVAGEAGYSGTSIDNVPATGAQLNAPSGTCFDSAGNMYIGDTGNNCVRRVDVLTGLATTVASGISNIVDVKIDSAGALYILTSNKLYRCTVNTSTMFNSPVIIAGNGSGFLEGGYAISSTLIPTNAVAKSMCIDTTGNIYIALSIGITQLLTDRVLADCRADVSSKNNVLFGRSSYTITDNPVPRIQTPANVYNNDFNAQTALYGYASTNVPATDGNSKPNSLQYIKNSDYNAMVAANTVMTTQSTTVATSLENKSSKQAILTYLGRVSDLIALHILQWTNILSTLRGSVTLINNDDPFKSDSPQYARPHLYPGTSQYNTLVEQMAHTVLQENFLSFNIYVTTYSTLRTKLENYQTRFRALYSDLTTKNRVTNTTSSPLHIPTLDVNGNAENIASFAYIGWGYHKIKIRSPELQAYYTHHDWAGTQTGRTDTKGHFSGCDTGGDAGPYFRLLSPHNNRTKDGSDYKIRKFITDLSGLIHDLTVTDDIRTYITSAISGATIEHDTAITTYNDAVTLYGTRVSEYNTAYDRYYGPISALQTLRASLVLNASKWSEILARLNDTYINVNTINTLKNNPDVTKDLKSLIDSSSPIYTSISTYQTTLSGISVTLDTIRNSGGVVNPSVVNNAKSRITAALSNTLLSVIDTAISNVNSGSLYNYNQGMIARYGQTTYTATPTSGTLAIYNTHYNALQIAIQRLTNVTPPITSPITVYPTSTQILAAQNQASAFIVKIDINGIIRKYADGLREPTGITIDSTGNLYIVEHYINKIYRLGANWNNSAPVWNQTPIIDTGSNKPYGIALDKNNNLWISCNANDVIYSPIGATLTGDAILTGTDAHKILNYSYNGTTYTLVNANQIGTGTAMITPYRNYYGNVSNPALKNPALLTIDKNNRLMFSQSALHSVLLVPLNSPSTTISNIKSIRFEPLAGRRVCLKSIVFSPAISAAQNITTNGTATVLPYLSNANDINPFINITFTSPDTISFASLTLMANAGDVDAVGMRVLLFDSTDTLVSNRATTTAIISTAGYTLNYDGATVNNS